ncbi:MAG: glucuronate isomerase [Chitinophagaceae bacterium]|nr:MAG: glucuronate isomerase [Chitinophagaceae bacterium]
MKKFLDENFLLKTPTAERLYHGFAKDLPIIDYHCHLPPEQIAADTSFENITQLWLAGDHYKWRGMRANGVDETYCTGGASDWEKFRAWAGTVPYTMRNPLYHWTHLELQRYFGINELLDAGSARRIYDACNEQLKSKEFSVRNLLRRMNVEVVCTTDDPVDSLAHHQVIKDSGFEIPVLPAFRPDKAMNTGDTTAFNQYVTALGAASGMAIEGFDDYLAALRKRHEFFATMGCVISDHGIEEFYADDYSDEEISGIFNQARSGIHLDSTKVNKFRSAMLHQFALWDWEKGWVQQYHFGVIRNNNTRMMKSLGPDTGWDSMGDFNHAKNTAKFLDRLDRENKLTKTILYNLNPSDNEMLATMTGNFNDGSSAGKIQWGSAWWFLDQKDGMTRQLNTLSTMGLVSRFVGMLTDSRSFLSFPRHEYFRRIVCDLFGDDVEAGELPDDIEWLGKLVQDICYYNAKNYFNWASPGKGKSTPGGQLHQ